MKANRGQIDRALATPAASRFMLLYGADDSGSRGLAKRVAAALGAEAERVDLSGTELRSDPARLADEAASISLFGTPRWILVEQAGDEIVPAVEALLEAGAAGNPVIIVAGALKGTSKLLKLALAAPDAWAFASYLPEGGDAGRLVAELARDAGLAVRGDVAARIAEACGGNRAIIAQELGKYALYLDAAPGAPKPLENDVLNALGADAEEGDLTRLVDSVLGGDAAALEEEMARLRAQGKEGITLIRAVLRRLMLLARLRAGVERGSRLDDVMASAGKSVFYKEKAAVTAQVRRWRAALIAKAVTRLAEAEHLVSVPGGPGIVAADEELFSICRQAARSR